MTFSLGNISSNTVLLHHPPLTAAAKPSKALFFSKPHTTTTMRAARLVIPARDRVIDFGKYKGRMLGTLPSMYLKWVSSNLRARDFEEWAELADQVLEDPIYKDRLEWEFAEKVLNGNNALSSSSIVLADDEKKGQMRSSSPVSELLGISERFGWDNEDKLGWSKIDFQLLGTSKGGRIPRLDDDEEEKGRRELPNTRRMKKEEKREGGVRVDGQRRKVRRERLRLRSSGVPQQMRMNSNSISGFRNESNRSREEEERIEDSRDEEIQADVYNPFPGRESLLRKVFNGGRKPFFSNSS